MSLIDFGYLALYLGILALITKPLGQYLERVFGGEGVRISFLIAPVEKFLYRVCRIDTEENQTWQKYATSLLVFTGVTFVFTYVILLYQHHLPLNPQGMAGMNWHLALNTAVSFVTNTNWQSYGGETTLGYFAQMVALTFQNFISAAVGIAVAVALIRAVGAREAKGIGSFWVDVTRANLYVLLPLSFLFALFLISQGVIQNFSSYVEATTLEGTKQVLAQGPAASQIAIKMLGTNGGGFFNANAAHPYENPTWLSNFVQMLSIFAIPSALVWMLGSRVNRRAHGWSVWGVMAILFVLGVVVLAGAEYAGNPALVKAGAASAQNFEGKEVRFGIFPSALFATITTAASCGAVNAMHDSLTPIGGLVPLLNMMFGEVVFGGVGAGLYGMMVFILLTVFIAGLMVGRTPEYMGKKIEAHEVKLVMVAVILPSLSILALTAWGVLDPLGLAGLANSGPHGLSEILYAFTSGTANNGSAFGGLTANTPFWTLTLSLAMIVGRFGVILPILAIAGSLARKKAHPGGSGSFPTEGILFGVLLIGVIVIVGALTFFPSLALGPIVEHFEMLRGTRYP